MSSMKQTWRILLVSLLLASLPAVQAQYVFSTNGDNTLTITGYSGPGGFVIIPATNISGMLVTSIGSEAFDNASVAFVMIPGSVTNIGDEAFWNCSSLTSVIVPGSVTSIGNEVFQDCPSLTSVYFGGNAPSVDGAEFAGDDPQNLTVYYLPGASGWDSRFAAIFTAVLSLPNPVILNSGPSFGVQNSTFGFVISWAANSSVVVEACTNLADSVWSPVSTNTLIGGWSYFSDPQWTNFPNRYYRLSSP
jgi:hypothetical protein